MLRLVARKADGWLPSLGRIGLDGLRAGNATIDTAAREAGRDPAAIRRLLNIGPDLGVDELAGLALDGGVATFIVAADDPALLERFATDVIPGVRARVAEERAAA
jgi:alkanesulfonate monooxygenase SsuD/methylene tetrahydromethanopterin reductase-like flavin-dependent oxidoreductase (luciferase family)